MVSYGLSCRVGGLEAESHRILRRDGVARRQPKRSVAGFDGNDEEIFRFEDGLLLALPKLVRETRDLSRRTLVCRRAPPSLSSSS